MKRSAVIRTERALDRYVRWTIYPRNDMPQSNFMTDPPLDAAEAPFQMLTQAQAYDPPDPPPASPRYDGLRCPDPSWWRPAPQPPETWPRQRTRVVRYDYRDYRDYMDDPEPAR